MKKTPKPNLKTAKNGKQQNSNQTLQKNLVSQVMRLFLILAVTLIVISSTFMYFSNMNTLHEMADVALNSTSSAVERTLHTLEVNAMNVASLETIQNTGCLKVELVVKIKVTVI